MPKIVIIDYTNWRGERRERRIRPLAGQLNHTKNKWHPSEQWLLTAVDEEDGKVKAFAMKDIHSWREALA